MAVPNPEVGQQLRRFFIELLEEQNLQRYRAGDEQRNDYIGERTEANDGYLGPEAEELVRCDCLRQIEEHIGAVEGSGRAIVVMVVCPPM